ncbi:MAG: hypothetical protein JXN61_01255 [Sedimentisphaerales bacterium]|nr:hypothetical protein [Sedimentisphaerales bacterium]
MSLRMWFLCLAFCLAASPAAGGETLPTGEDIDELAEAAKSIVSGFKTASSELRFQYEYSGRFLDPTDKEKLHFLAAQASEHLRETADSQQEIKSQIEVYEGDDWEDRYGATGLWRKLFADFYAANVNRLEMDFHVAICGGQENRDVMLRQMPARIDALEQDYDTAYLQLLRAKALGLLASEDPAYESLARRQFDLLLDRSDMQQSTAFRIAIERIKLFGPGDNDRLAQLGQELAQSDVNDPELFLSVACLQHRLNMPDAFEETVNLRPGLLDKFIGVLALRDLNYRLEHSEPDLGKTSVFEVELAVQAAWRDVPQDWIGLLRCLVQSERFRTPLTLYVTALACAEVSPGEAVGFLLRAAELQKDDQSRRLGIEAETIAEQAAKLACNAYSQGRLDEHAVLDVFDGFQKTAGQCADDELEYCFATALMAAGQKEKAAELLRKIASEPQANRRYWAKLDLITNPITRDHYTDPNKREEALRDLLDLLTTCGDQNDPGGVRPEAMRIYCELLLDSPQTSQAQKALDILTAPGAPDNPGLKALKSKALRYLDRLDESAECLAELCRGDNPEYALEAEKLLVAVIEKIEQLQEGSADFSQLHENCLGIARYCERISLSCFGLIPVGQARLYVAEISLFDVTKEPKKLDQIEELLDALPDEYKKDSVDFLRCQARLLAERGKFADAADLWAKVADFEKRRSTQSNQRNVRWWQAKYYELLCFSKIPETKKKDISHSIEVLLNSFTEIPPLWAGRLTLLKQQCSELNACLQHL